MEGGGVIIVGCAEREEVLGAVSRGDREGRRGDKRYLGGFGDGFAEDFDLEGTEGCVEGDGHGRVWGCEDVRG